MRTANKLIVTVIIVLLLATIAILGSSVIRQSRLSESSREFAIRVIPIVLSGNPLYAEQEDLADAPLQAEPPTAAETFASFAHPLLLERQSLDDFGKYLYTVTLNLGPLEVVQSIAGGSEAPLFVFDSQPPSAAYEAQVEFSGGSARVEIEMLLEQGDWLITEFSVETALLAD